MKREDPATLRDRMLDAAEAVVVRQGIANLTFEAVAAEASISKGGLLHHFPSKDKLIEGMVTRCADNWRAFSTVAYESMPAGRGRMARALLSHLADAEMWTEQCQRSSSAVFAALAQNPVLIEPMRAAYDEVRKKLIADGLPPGVGDTVIAAMDGLWLYRVLGLRRVNQELMNRIRKTLEPLVLRDTRTSAPVAGRAAARVPSAKPRGAKPAASSVKGPKKRGGSR